MQLENLIEEIRKYKSGSEYYGFIKPIETDEEYVIFMNLFEDDFINKYFIITEEKEYIKYIPKSNK